MSEGPRQVYKYTFPLTLNFGDAEETFVLALLGTEQLHGEAQVRLDLVHGVHRRQRTILVDSSTPVGTDLNRLFCGFLQREFGAQSFHVERLSVSDGTDPFSEEAVKAR